MTPEMIMALEDLRAFVKREIHKLYLALRRDQRALGTRVKAMEDLLAGRASVPDGDGKRDGR